MEGLTDPVAQEILKMVFNYGLCGVVIAYYIVKDWKFTGSQMELMGAIKHLLERLDNA